MNRIAQFSGVLCVFAVFLFGTLAQAATEPRVALIVGNAGYTNISTLANPANDAELMHQTLSALGFDAVLVRDGDRSALVRAIRDFGKRIARAGPDAVALFFYAGHGVQAGDQNYLIPLNAPIETEADLDVEAVSADWVLRQMAEAGNALNLVILDACRNNPFRSSFRSATNRGLTRLNAPAGALVAYSAAPGQVAADGTGRNSPYTAALARAMLEPGKELLHVFREARIEVKRETSGQQVPWEEQSVTADFYFIPQASRESAGAGGNEGDPAAQAWSVIQNSDSIAVMQSFVKKYPGSLYSDFALARLEELIVAEGGQQVAALPSPAPDPGEALAVGAADAAAKCDELAASREDMQARMQGVTTFVEDWQIDPPAAIAACRAAMEHNPNEPRYGYQLGRALYRGIEFEEAVAVFKIAAEAGHHAAARTLANFYEEAKAGLRASGDDVVHWYLVAMQSGDPQAFKELAKIHGQGIYVRRDVDKANELAQSAFEFAQDLVADSDYVARNGHLAALKLLYEGYRDGFGTEQDDARAYENLLKLAEAGETFFYFHVILAHQYGRLGQPVDMAAGRAFSRRYLDALHADAERGDVRAYVNLGSYYHFPNAFAVQDQARGCDYYERAANAGHRSAILQLASCYRAGEGRPRDSDAEEHWWKKYDEWTLQAALRGDAAALQEERYGATADEHVQNLRRAAELGNGWAMVELGGAYREGRYVAKDVRQAIQWFERATRTNRAPSAYVRLVQIYTSKTDGMNRYVTTAEVWLRWIRIARYDTADAYRNTTDMVTDSGDDIPVRIEIQKELRKLGFYSGSIDGSFGPMTLRAIEAYASAD